MSKRISSIKKGGIFFMLASMLFLSPSTSLQAEDGSYEGGGDEYITYDDAGPSDYDNAGMEKPRRKCYKYQTFNCTVTTVSSTSASGSISINPSNPGVSGSYSTNNTVTTVSRRMCANGSTESVCINENCAGLQVSLLCSY